MWIIVTKSLGERMGEKDRNGRRDKENGLKPANKNAVRFRSTISRTLADADALSFVWYLHYVSDLLNRS